MGDLRLEGFGGFGACRGHRALLVGKPGEWLSRVATLESESLYKGRTILVTQLPPRGIGTASQQPPSTLFRRRWDAVFSPRDTFDLQMLATYVANAPKPVRVVWWSSAGQEIPRVLWSKWTGDVSLIGCSETGDVMSCEWEAIFFPLFWTAGGIETVLAKRGTGQRLLASGISAHLEDIRSKGAAIVWSMIDEKDGRGSLYWYDPTEGDELSKGLMSKGDVLQALDDVKEWIGKA